MVTGFNQAGASQSQNPFGVVQVPGLPAMSTIDFGNGVVSVIPNLPDPSLINTSAIYGEQQQQAPYNYVNPLEYAQAYGDFNLSRFAGAGQAGRSSALQASQTELEALKSYAPAVAELQQTLLQAQNQFNQKSRLQQFESALPGGREAIQEGIDRGRTYASGKLYSSAEDRAFETSARNAVADFSSSRGFGDDSTFGRKQSELLSAKERLNLSQIGDSMAQRWLELGSRTLLDSPIKATAGATLSATPSFSVGGNAINQQNNALNLSTISPTTGAQINVGQNQFQTNQLQGIYASNASQAFQAQQVNAANALQVALNQYNAGFGNATAFQNSIQGGYNALAAQQQQALALQTLQQQQAQQQSNAFWGSLLNAGVQIAGSQGLFSQGGLFS